MNFRSSSIVTGIVTAVVTITVSIVTPVSAEILTVCANPTQSATGSEWLPSRRLADAIIPMGGRVDQPDGEMIALWRDDSGFDLLINWGETNERSLRADGAQIIGAGSGSELVHLMVAHPEGELEHFLFNLQDGSGELMRKSAAGDADTPANAVCVKPR